MGKNKIPKFINLLSTFPKIIRNVKGRDLKDKKKNVKIAMKFGKAYFDGKRSQGYGGYYYDGRWEKVAKKLIKLFKLKDNSNFLDIGCAKGYLLYEIHKLNPKINIYGLDISNYAIKEAKKEIKSYLKVFDCRKKLPYKKNFFDGVVAINTVHNFSEKKCRFSIREIQRVSNGNAFIQVDSYTNNKELEAFKRWMLTAKTYYSISEWKKLFKKEGYSGFYNWTILKIEESNL